MTKTNLKILDVDALLGLRAEIDLELESRRDLLQSQLQSLGMGTMVNRRARGGSTLLGKKVAAKYRGPHGETWAGRGAKPRWLVAATSRTGKKMEDFLIDKKKRKTATEATE